MTTPLPGWPRHLTRAMAADYLGVSASTFDAEVRAGLWPRPLRRGVKGNRFTWDRKLLDQAADRLSGLLDAGAPRRELAPGEQAALERAAQGTVTTSRQQAKASDSRGAAVQRNPPPALSVSQLARLWGVSTGKIYTMIAQRKLPHLRIGTLIRFRREDVEAYQQALAAAGRAESAEPRTRRSLPKIVMAPPGR